MRAWRASVAAASLLVASGLAAATASPPPAPERDWLSRRPYPPVPIGPAPEFQPGPSAGPRATCRSRRRIRHLVHLELFADGMVVVVPAGLGVGGRWKLNQGRVAGGRCWQSLFTTEPTGVLMVAARTQTLGDLFSRWGRALSRSRMLGFRGRVRAYVAGRLRPGDPRSIPLGRRTQVVLEVGPYVRPHRAYRFPRALETIRTIGGER